MPMPAIGIKQKLLHFRKAEKADERHFESGPVHWVAPSQKLTSRPV